MITYDRFNQQNFSRLKNKEEALYTGHINTSTAFRLLGSSDAHAKELADDFNDEPHRGAE